MTPSDPLIEWMKKNGVPVTRHNYLTIAYMGAPPEEIDPELASEREDLFPEEDPDELEQANEETYKQ